MTMISPSDRLVLEPGQVDLWFALPGHPEVEHRAEDYQQLLAESELERYNQLKMPEHKEEYLLSRALLRTTLARYSGIAPADLEFVRNRFGKPELGGEEKGSPLHFNVAHTCGLVVCAVTSGASVGIDVEYHANSQALLQVADDYFSETEVADLKSCPPEVQNRHFFRYWTLKESFIKAKGEGLSIPLDSFSFRFDGDEVMFIPSAMTVEQGEHWFFELMQPSDDYTAALAVSRPISSLRLYEAIPLSDASEVQSCKALFSEEYWDSHHASLG